MVELIGVTGGYGRQMAVQDFSLTLPSGEVAALVGPNGCGKSTAAADGRGNRAAIRRAGAAERKAPVRLFPPGTGAADFLSAPVPARFPAYRCKVW